MATYNLADGAVAAHAKALAAGTEDVVNFPARYGIGDPQVLIHPGTPDPVYVCSGSAAATVGGDHCRVIWPGWALKLDDVSNVRLISAGAAVYSVEGS